VRRTQKRTWAFAARDQHRGSRPLRTAQPQSQVRIDEEHGVFVFDSPTCRATVLARTMAHTRDLRFREGTQNGTAQNYSKRLKTPLHASRMSLTRGSPGPNLSPSVVTELRDYRAHTGITTGSLFRGRIGAVSTSQNWCRALERACKSIGVKTVTPYGCRHFWCNSSREFISATWPGD
jgi:hypothetical protein